jgi:hypothetical protein
MTIPGRGRKWIPAVVVAIAPVIWLGIIGAQRRRSVADSAITVSLSPALVKDGIALQWQGLRDRDTPETMPLHPGQQAIRGYYAWNEVELYCPAVSGRQRFILSSPALRQKRLDSRVTCMGTIDDFHCVLEAGGESEERRGTCYPPDGPTLVSVEPLDHDVEGTARLEVVADAARPLKGRLQLAGRPYENQQRDLRSPLGILTHSVYEKSVPASTRALTTLHLGRVKLLVALQPGSVLAVRSGDCASWELDSSWLNAEGEGTFRVRAATGTPFTITAEPNGKVTQEVVPAAGITRYYPAIHRRCGRDGIATASDRAMFGIGAGERWTINLSADGRILGGIREP